MENLKKHFWHYVVYFLIFGSSLLAIFFATGKSDLQATLVLMAAFAYFIWAMVHHYVHHQLHPRVVVEYILVVVLGSVLILFLFAI